MKDFTLAELQSLADEFGTATEDAAPILAPAEPFEGTGEFPQETYEETPPDPLKLEADLGFKTEGSPEDVQYYTSACDNALSGEEAEGCYRSLLKNAFGTDIDVQKAPHSQRPYFLHPQTGEKTYLQTPGLTMEDVEYFGKHAAIETGGEVTGAGLAFLSQLAKRKFNGKGFKGVKNWLLQSGIAAGAITSELGTGIGSFIANVDELSDLRQRGALPERFGSPETDIWDTSAPGNNELYMQAGKNASLAQVGATGSEILFGGLKRFIGVKDIQFGKEQEDAILKAVNTWQTSGAGKVMQQMGAEPHLGHALTNQARIDIKDASDEILAAEAAVRNATTKAQRDSATIRLDNARARLQKAEQDDVKASVAMQWIDSLKLDEGKALQRATQERSVPHAAALLLQQRLLQAGIAKDKLDLTDELGQEGAEWVTKISGGILGYVDNAYRAANNKPISGMHQAWADANAWAQAAINAGRSSADAGEKVGSLIRLAQAQFDIGADNAYKALDTFVDKSHRAFNIGDIGAWARTQKEQLLQGYPKGARPEVGTHDAGTLAELDRLIGIADEGGLVNFDRINEVIKSLKINRSAMYGDPSKGSTKTVGELINQLETVRTGTLNNLAKTYRDSTTGRNLFKETLDVIGKNNKEASELYKSAIIREVVGLHREGGKKNYGRIIGTITDSTKPEIKDVLNKVSRNVRDFMDNASPQDKEALQEIMGLHPDIAVDPSAADAVQLIRDAIKKDWADTAIPKIRDRAAAMDLLTNEQSFVDFVAKENHLDWMKKNKDLVDFWFNGSDELALFNDAAAMGKKMLREEKAFKQVTDNIRKKFKFADVGDPLELFDKVWIPVQKGGRSRSTTVLDSLTRKLPDGSREPIDEGAAELLTGFRTQIANDLIDKTFKIGKNGNVTTVDLQAFRDYMKKHRLQLEDWFADSVTLPNGQVVKGNEFLKIIDDAVEMASPRMTKKGGTPSDDADQKALMDLTRAYVGIFTTPGRMITAAKRIWSSSRDKDVFFEMMDPAAVRKQILYNRTLNSQFLHRAVRVLGALYTQENYTMTSPEDLELGPSPSAEMLELQKQFAPERPEQRPTRPEVRPERPMSSLGSEDFAPRVAAPAASPTPAAAPMQGGLGAYLPPSMRNPNSMLAQAAQRQQPMMMNEGGFVDPYSNAGVMDWMGMGADAVRTAVKYGIPLDANTTLGYQGLMGGDPDTPAQKHMAAYEQLYGNIGKRVAPTDRGSGSLYDRAKNFAGGFDWGHRMGQEGSDDAERMARAYQGKQFLQAKLSNTTPEPERSALMQDAIGDYNENMAGVRAGIASRMADEDMPTIEDLSERAIRWAKNNKRKITVGKGRR